LALLLLLDILAVVVELLISWHVIVDTEASRKTEAALHILSLSILSFFVLETSLLVVAYGREFFRHPFYVLDLFVVFCSFILDVTIYSDEVEFFLILRLWRVVRVLHGVYSVVEIQHEEKEALKERIKELEAQLEEERELRKSLEQTVQK